MEYIGNFEKVNAWPTDTMWLQKSEIGNTERFSNNAALTSHVTCDVSVSRDVELRGCVSMSLLLPLARFLSLSK